MSTKACREAELELKYNLISQLFTATVVVQSAAGLFNVTFWSSNGLVLSVARLRCAFTMLCTSSNTKPSRDSSTGIAWCAKAGQLLFIPFQPYLNPHRLISFRGLSVKNISQAEQRLYRSWRLNQDILCLLLFPATHHLLCCDLAC